MLTLEDLGVLRSVELEQDERVVVTITPTYSGCPAMATMRDDLVHRLARRRLRRRGPGQPEPGVVERLDHAERAGPRWRSTGSRPGPGADGVRSGLSLLPTRRALTCPRCGRPRSS